MAEQELTHDVQLALLNQRVDMLEKDMNKVDDDIKQLRLDVQKGFDKMIEKFDTLKSDMADTKSFGKGVYWVVGGIISTLVLFKDQIIGLFHK